MANQTQDLEQKARSALDNVKRYGLGSDLVERRDLVYGVVHNVFPHSDIVKAQMTYREGATFDRNALAREYGSYYKIGQKEGEIDDAYRSRVAGELRRQGQLIEAHEAFSGRRYDDPAQGTTGPMAGIFGAVAQAMQGREYSPHDSERQIGDDIAAGVYVQNKNDSTERLLGAIFGVLGPSAGMDLIDSMHRKDKK